MDLLDQIQRSITSTCLLHILTNSKVVYSGQNIFHSKVLSETTKKKNCGQISTNRDKQCVQIVYFIHYQTGSDAATNNKATTWTKLGLQLVFIESFFTWATAALAISWARWTVKLPSVSVQPQEYHNQITQLWQFQRGQLKLHGNWKQSGQKLILFLDLKPTRSDVLGLHIRFGVQTCAWPSCLGCICRCIPHSETKQCPQRPPTNVDCLRTQALQRQRDLNINAELNPAQELFHFKKTDPESTSASIGEPTLFGFCQCQVPHLSKDAVRLTKEKKASASANINAKALILQNSVTAPVATPPPRISSSSLQKVMIGLEVDCLSRSSLADLASATAHTFSPMYCKIWYNWMPSSTPIKLNDVQVAYFIVVTKPFF